MENRIPRLHSPVNSRRIPEVFEDLCENKTGFLYVFVENRVLLFAPVDFRRKTKALTPYPSSLLHPVSITRFPSFRTQPLESLSVDSANKWIPEQPSPWRKS